MISRFAIAKEHIINDLEGVIGELLGPAANPRFKRRKAWNVSSPWRARSKPTQTIIHLTGARRGAFTDYVDGEKGDAIDLVAWGLEGRVTPDSRMRAVEWAEERFGIRSMSPQARRQMQAEASAKRTAMQAREARRIKAARDRARKFFFSCEAQIFGSPVETYLRARGIEIREVPNLAPAIRFHPACENWMHAPQNDKGEKTGPGPRFPAMITAMVNAEGRLSACHYTFLAHDGSGKAPIDGFQKLMFPDTSGLIMRLTYGPSNLNMEKAAAAGQAGPAGYTEGVEDALSAGWADPGLRMNAAGSLPNLLSIPDHDAVSGYLIFQDNDWTTPQAVAQFERAYARIRGFGKPAERMRVLESWGKDINDAIRQGD